MFLVGVLIYLSMTFLGHYYIQGVGYAGIEDVLTGKLSDFKLLILLFVLKLLVTALTLGSGASGGIFSPALFLGAMAGGAYGVALKAIFPFLPVSPPVFALAGMAGMVSGSTGAAITALVMVFEMTLDYNCRSSVDSDCCRQQRDQGRPLPRDYLHFKTGPARPFYAKCPEDRFPVPEAGKKHHGKSSGNSSGFRANRGFCKAGYPGRRFVFPRGRPEIDFRYSFRKRWRERRLTPHQARLWAILLKKSTSRFPKRRRFLRL